MDPAAVLTTSQRLPRASSGCFGAGSSAEPGAVGAVVAGLLAAAELLLTGAAGLLGAGAAGSPVTGEVGLLSAGAARLPVTGFGCVALSGASGAGHGWLADHGSRPRAAPSLWLNRSIARSSAASALAASPRALARRRPCWWAETSTTRAPGSACTRRACSCIGLPGGSDRFLECNLRRA